MPIRVAYPTPDKVSVNVPQGHRAKCRQCGAVDNIRLVGSNRVKRCGACGATLVLKSAPRKVKVLSYEVIFQLNGEPFGSASHITEASAEFACWNFVERGPVARIRVAQLVELLDGAQTGNIRQLRYDNYRGRRQSIVWVKGCEVCKGSGLVVVTLKQREGPSLVKFIPCVACGSLGGSLTREVNYKRLRA